VHSATRNVFLEDLRDAVVSITKLDEAQFDQFWREALESQDVLGLDHKEVEKTVMKVQRNILKALECRHGDTYRTKEFRAWVLGTNRTLYEYYTMRMGDSKQSPNPLSIDSSRQFDFTSPAHPKPEDFYLPSSATISPLDISSSPPTSEPNTSSSSNESPPNHDDLDAILSELLIPINHLWSKPAFDHAYTSPPRKEFPLPDSPTYPIFGLVSEEEEEDALHECVAFECEDEEGRIWKEPRGKWEFGFC
jgi:hypothetical protein